VTRRAHRWSYEAPGSYRGCTVAVYEESNGMLYGREGLAGRSKRKALKHQDKERAKAWARARLQELVAGERILDGVTPTSAKLIGAYLEARTPLKASKNTRKQDARAAAMWQKVLGADFDLSILSPDELDRFTRDRQSGAIDAKGEPVIIEKRRTVRARAVAADLEFLRAVLLWASGLPKRRRLLPDNPMHGYQLPREANPRRPVASQDRYEKLQAVADQVHPFLGAILNLANETGSRITAVLSLR
jgi:hypothetical protein